jgi:hypothetical protein
MNTSFTTTRPNNFPSSLPTTTTTTQRPPLPVPITPSHGLHTPPFTPQSAPCHTNEVPPPPFPSFFVNVPGRRAESTKGIDPQSSPVSAPGSFVFRTPFANRQIAQQQQQQQQRQSSSSASSRSQASSIGESNTDCGSHSSYSATPSDCEDFEMDLNAVMLSDESTQQQMMAGYTGVQPNESAIR